MRALNPAWMHVTWGAGGSTQDRSLELAGAAQELGLDVCLHLTCTNMDQSVLDSTLERARQLGIRNILALRGDPPRGEEYWVASSDELQHATDLVKYIRRAYGDYFCIGVAAYPEGHADSPDRSEDVRFLKAKQDAGADFIVTQLFYDVPAFLEWYESTKRSGVTVPILPGIMPIQNYQSFRRMTNLCKSHIPENVLQELESIKHDDAAVKDYGVDLSVDIMQQLRAAGIRGFHLCTLNLEKSITRVLEKLGWVQKGQLQPPTRSNVCLLLFLCRAWKLTPFREKGQPSGAALLPKSVTALRGTAEVNGSSNGGDSKLSRQDSPTSWDEFPNGRFGDARSPAYGELDGWGAGLKTPVSHFC